MTSRKKTPRSIGRIGGKKMLVPKWKLFRAKEPLISVLMWGVNHTIGELMHVPPPGLLLPDDFKAFSKIKVDNHCFNKDNMPSHFKIKDYCPNVFRNIREQFGIDQYEYLASLTSYEPEAEQQEGVSGSSSSSGLFVSCDRKFVIKVIDSEAVAEIHSILKQYHEYVVKTNGKTLLPQYLGLYRITVDGNETYLLVMRNIFSGKYNIHKKYDLKGSTIQRQASEKEKSKDLPTLKDNDFLEDNSKLILPAEAKKQIMCLLKNDTEFLTKLHLMDYSLLVGIHDFEIAALEEINQHQVSAVYALDSDSAGEELAAPTPPESPIPSSGAFAAHSAGLNIDDEFFAIPSCREFSKKFIYFIGLVDILTYYGVKKRTASAAKAVKYGSEAENISTVKPEQYARRLLEFVNKNVITPIATDAVTTNAQSSVSQQNLE